MNIKIIHSEELTKLWCDPAFPPENIKDELGTWGNSNFLYDPWLVDSLERFRISGKTPKGILILHNWGTFEEGKLTDGKLPSRCGSFGETKEKLRQVKADNTEITLLENRAHEDWFVMNAVWCLRGGKTGDFTLPIYRDAYTRVCRALQLIFPASFDSQSQPPVVFSGAWAKLRVAPFNTWITGATEIPAESDKTFGTYLRMASQELKTPLLEVPSLSGAKIFIIRHLCTHIGKNAFGSIVSSQLKSE